MPVSGMTPITPPMLMSACTTIHTVIPVARWLEKRSSARAAIRTPSHANAPNANSTQSDPARPRSLPMTAKMKSVCAFGNRPQGATEVPTPEPVRWPEPSATSDCTIW